MPRTEIGAFFDSHVDAFGRWDADAACDRWERVGLFPSPAGHSAMDRPTFRDHCVTLMDFYRGQGVVRVQGELLSAAEIVPPAIARRPGIAPSSVHRFRAGRAAWRPGRAAGGPTMTPAAPGAAGGRRAPIVAVVRW